MGSRPETPQGDTQVSLQPSPACERKSVSKNSGGHSGGPRDGVAGVVRSPDGRPPRSSSRRLAGHVLHLAHHHHLLRLRLLRQSSRAQADERPRAVRVEEHPAGVQLLPAGTVSLSTIPSHRLREEHSILPGGTTSQSSSTSSTPSSSSSRRSLPTSPPCTSSTTAPCPSSAGGVQGSSEEARAVSGRS